MKRLVLAAAVCVASFGALAIARTQAPPDQLDPVRVAGDTHKLAFENAFVRVLDVHVPPGSREPRHRHPHGLSVYFTDWDVRATADGAAPETRHRTAGTFAWNEAVVHAIENVGKTEGHVLRVELKF